MNTTESYKKYYNEDFVAGNWVLKENETQCLLCPHNCLLKNGEIGKCGVRKNKEGKLISLVYGYPCAIHIDPIEKKPLYHFMPGSKTFSLSTLGCNLDCLNCQNHTISHPDIIENKFDFISPDEIVSMAKKHNCNSISYTYTDPVIYYEYARDIATIAKKSNMKNIIVSAGYIHKKPLRELCSYLDAANIDLKSFEDKSYQKLCGIHLKPVLDSLKVLRDEGVWLEITHLIVPGYTDDINVFKEMCNWLVNNGFREVPLHLSRFFPAHKLIHKEPTSLSYMEKAYRIAQDVGLCYVYLGNVNKPSYQNTHCSECGKLLIERWGNLTIDTYLVDGKCEKCQSVLNGVF